MVCCTLAGARELCMAHVAGFALVIDGSNLLGFTPATTVGLDLGVLHDCVGVRPTSCMAESLVCVTENLYKQAEQFCNDFESELSAALKKPAYANAILAVIYKVPLLLSSSLLWQCRAMIAWWQEMLNPCTGKCDNKCCSNCSSGERQHAKLIERGKPCPALHSLPLQVPAQMYGRRPPPHFLHRATELFELSSQSLFEPTPI